MFACHFKRKKQRRRDTSNCLLSLDSHILPLISFILFSRLTHILFFTLRCVSHTLCARALSSLLFGNRGVFVGFGGIVGVRCVAVDVVISSLIYYRTHIPIHLLYNTIPRCASQYACVSEHIRIHRAMVKETKCDR